MAIAPCEECGKDRSDKAQVCPHCGHKRPGRWKKRLLYGLGAGAVFFGVMVWIGSSPEAEQRAKDRAVIDLCRKDAQSNLTIRRVCEQMERDYRSRWNREP
jgi:hypothetical protein